MNKEMQIIREINIEAEDFYADAVQLGDHAAHALTWRHRSQMTGLENIADSALKSADVFDYIKLRTARYTYWRQGFASKKKPDGSEGPYPDLIFGERLRLYLEERLADRRDDICRADRLDIGNDSDEHKHLRRHIYLLLIRQLIHQMVAHYEYRVSVANEKMGV